MSSRPFGSIIGPRPEHTSHHRVLHRHVFPGVLDRIARSHIRNYWIYLQNNLPAVRARGGGYLILVSEAPMPNTVGVKIRRRGAD